MEGKQVLGYELRRKLGEGGMATVYYAENRLGKSAAVKVLKPELSRIGDLRQRFEQEARLMARLSHPNIRGVLDISEVEGCPAILMEYLAGQDLGSYVKQKGAIPVQLANSLWIEAVGAIAYAHSQGVIHRDIKPSNFFLTEGGDLKLLDFGIAKASDQLTQTLTGQQMGTILYMSPEQVKDPKRVGKETDYYSLGVTFYYLLTGRAPYDMLSESGFQIQMRIVQEDLDLGVLPLEWQRVLGKCLAKDPLQRAVHGDVGAEQGGYVKGEETVFEDVKDAGNQKGKFTGEESSIEKKEIKRRPYKWLLLPLLLSLVWWLINGKGSRGDIIVAKLEGNMVYVEGGSFKMGCTGEQGDDCFGGERPVHEVTLSGYYLGKYEVTQGEWREVMGNSPSYFGNCDQCPVEQVSWKDVEEFISKLNGLTGKRYRLPTEAEWEYASRGGRSSRGYKYSGSNNLGDVGWNDDNSGGKTHPVGQKRSNELGLYDMSGNVLEWCSDWFGYYNDGFETNPRRPSKGNYLVVRGGSWGNIARHCRVSNRGGYDLTSRNAYSGFRLARSSK